MNRPHRLPPVLALAFLAPLLASLILVGCDRSKTSQSAGAAPVTDPTPPPDPGPGIFTDVTASSGVDFTYRNGEEADQLTILESLGGGVALFDYDGDGLLDIFVT